MRICLMCRKRNMEHYGICPECQALNDRMQELIAQIEMLCGGKLDILINNAAQTVKKSNDYYAALTAHENALMLESSALYMLAKPDSALSVMPSIQASDHGETERDNSWVRKSEEISPQELLEVQLINVTAPFMLTSGLRHCLTHDPYLSFDDGAARVLYPVTLHLHDEKIKDSGLFYKDYHIIEY